MVYILVTGRIPTRVLDFSRYDIHLRIDYSTGDACPLLVPRYYTYMYVYTCDFHFFYSDTSLRARTFVRKVGWGGHNSTVGLTLPEVWARSVQCVACGKPFKLFWPWAWIRQIPGFPQHPASWARTKDIPFFMVLYPWRVYQNQR